MSQGPVAIRIGGQTYRVKAQASEQELHRLAASVDARLRDLTANPSSPTTPQALLLVAISLAHELESERAAHQRLRCQTKELLQLLLEQVDRTLHQANAALSADTHLVTTSDS